MEFPELKNLPPHEPARFATIDDGLNADPEMTNGKRAAEALNKLASFNFDDDCEYIDLMVNLLHLAHSRGLEPTDILSSAANNFAAEAGPLPS